jgi:UDP-glucose 4-epimerase
MTAVITGGLGFIGSHLVDRCLAEGMDVLVIDDCRSTKQRATELWPSEPRVRFLMADCRHVVLPVRAEVVFHLASPVGPVGVLNRAGHITPEVLEGSRAAARWAMRDQVPMIDVSTSEVYGGGDQGLCAETMPRIVEPGAWARLEYQTAKLAAEVMLLNTVDLDVRIIRPFNVAGPRQSPAGGFVLPRMVQQALIGQPLTVYTPGTQRRALTHVLDIVDGIWLAWRKGEANRDYNLGNPGNTCSMMALAHEVADYVGGADVTVVDPVGLHGEQFK